MKLVRNLNFLKGVAIFLCLILIQNGFEIQALDGKYEKELAVMKEKYKTEKYDEIIVELEKLLNEIGEENTRIRGQFFLLLGAAREKTGNREKAIENYLLGDLILDKPEIDGIDLNSLKIYRNTLFIKVINGTRVFEKVGKRKKKRKFPYLAILGVAALVTAVFILTKKKSGDGVDNLSKLHESCANDIFNTLEWVDIPAGEFLMGDDHGLGSADELPVHKVYLDSYKISKYEITYDQFDKFADINTPIIIYHEGNGGNYPVTHVTPDNGDRFCSWMKKYTGKNIYLPTEAQWEKAARGTDNRIYPWGNETPDCSIVNFNNCSSKTSIVGSHPNDISFYGVMDMGGNVTEMVRDAYQADYYSVSPYSNPTGPDTGDLSSIVIRGGNWNSSDTRASNRTKHINGAPRDSTTGFRIVWEG